MEDKLMIPEYAKLKVYWDDRPENYSREAKLKVRNYFSKKYGINKYNINVIYRPVKIGKNGEVIEISGAGIDNIMDKNYQIELMKEWYKREGKTIDFKRLLDLDKKVNGSLTIEYEVLNHRSWELKWLFIDNFLCFGENNFASFGNLNGLNIVTSEPPNQGGKTTFSVDAVKFLLYGRTTKTDKNEQIFNTYRDNNKLVVRGMLEIEGEETIIERKLTRTAKKSGGWTVINKVNYYKVLPDGEEILLNEQDSKETGKKITNNIGTEKDFDITILATGRNLEDLVDAKPTESGRLLTKFIGLEVIESKEVIAKKMNSDFNKTKKGNHYNIVSLLAENETEKENVTLFKSNLKQHNDKLETIIDTINKLEIEKERLLNSKLNVDVVIAQLNPEMIESDIETITKKGLEYKNENLELEKQIKEIKDISYDEDLYHNLSNKERELNIKIGALENSITNFGKVIDSLENDEICQTCERPLDGVDNSSQIKEYKVKINDSKEEINTSKSELNDVNEKIDNININRELVNKRNHLELQRDKNEVEIGSLRNKIVAKKEDLKKYKANESAIKTNINIEADISAVKTDLIVENISKESIAQKIFTTKASINASNDKIVWNNNMIHTLKGEEEIEKVFKVYLEMIGKKGISKLVLRSVLPIINSELYRLLDDVCDFEVELVMTDKNEIEYHLIKSGVTKLLKSGSGLERTIASLGLRCVLGKISHLPTPNFITFDEVLGKVAAINIEKLKPMFEKIKDMFDIVFFITHNDLVKDWGDKIIIIKKKDDISSITLK
jgi:DNA repair exonuclease SbcCD ATPase subunit